MARNLVNEVDYGNFMTNRASAQEPGQAGKRRYAIFRDQFGREWGGVTEDKTRHPLGPLDARIEYRDKGTGQLVKGEGWVCRPPFMPDSQYFIFDAVNASRVWVAYDQMLRDIRVGRESYDRDMRNAAKNLYGQGAIAAAIRDPQPELIDAVGLPPLTVPPELIEAAIAGNKWALGLSDKMPSWAESIMEQWNMQREAQLLCDHVQITVDSTRYPDAEDEEGYVPPSVPEPEVPEGPQPGDLKHIAGRKWGMIQDDGSVGPLLDGEYFMGKRGPAQEYLDGLRAERAVIDEMNERGNEPAMATQEG